MASIRSTTARTSATRPASCTSPTKGSCSKTGRPESCRRSDPHQLAANWRNGIFRVASALEARVGLVPASVFKTDVTSRERRLGGFDSHALPPRYITIRQGRRPLSVIRNRLGTTAAGGNDDGKPRSRRQPDLAPVAAV